MDNGFDRVPIRDPTAYLTGLARFPPSLKAGIPALYQERHFYPPHG